MRGYFLIAACLCALATSKKVCAGSLALGGGFTTLVTTTSESKDLYDGFNYSVAAYFGKKTQFGLIANFGSLTAASTANAVQTQNSNRYIVSLRKSFGEGSALFEGGVALDSTGHFGVSAAAHLRLKMSKRFSFVLAGRYTYLMNLFEDATYIAPSGAIEYQF